jgi:signal peptidase I
MDNTGQPAKNTRNTIRDIVITIVLAVAVFFVIRVTIQSAIVVGYSMEPSFNDGERLIVSKVTYTFTSPQRGDVIILRPPNNQNEDYIKRIIGLPGDIVEVKNGSVYVNHIQLTEPYIKAAPTYTMAAVTVPAEHYFVLGDNRNHSNDSHTGWTISREDIIGITWLAIWPPGDWGWAPNYDISDTMINSGETQT